MTVWIRAVYPPYYGYAIITNDTKHTSLLYQAFFKCTIKFSLRCPT